MATESRKPGIWRALEEHAGAAVTDLTAAAQAYLDKIRGRVANLPGEVTPLFKDVTAARARLAQGQ